jgi:hypothetical protein
MSNANFNPVEPEKDSLKIRTDRILAYLGGAISADIFCWLKTDVIRYPEMIDDALKNIDRIRFDEGCLSKQECWTLFENLVQTHESYTLIDSMMGDYSNIT